VACPIRNLPNLILVAGATVVVASACASRPRTIAPPAATREGRTTFRVLSKPAAPARADEIQVTIIPVAPGSENQLPAYPADALGAGCGQGVVAVRIHIGPLGRVVKQVPVPGRHTPSDSCHVAFGTEVEATVENWGFFPALRQTCAPRKGGPPSCSSVPIESYVDLEFLFDLVDGQPRVRPR
jgi:outer membrane biosynthesis protein TonB